MNFDTTAHNTEAAFIPFDGVYTQKPNAIDDIPTAVYDKPNEYDTDEHRQTLPQEVLEDLIVRPQFINGKRPDIKTNDEDEEADQQSHQPQHNNIPKLLSQKPATAITGITIQSLDEISSGGASAHDSEQTNVSADSRNDALTNTAVMTSKMALLQILSKDPMEELLHYDLRKASLSRPFDHDVYFHGTKTLAFKKLQPHSYSWGFQNILYRSNLAGTQHSSTDVNSAIKIAVARRRAFKKEITIEWGDFSTATTSFHEHSSRLEDPIHTPNSAFTHSNQLQNRTKSHLLFVYDTEFEDYSIRWKRVGLLSHDLTCEIKPGSDHSILSAQTDIGVGSSGSSSNNDSDGKRKWRMIAEFDSHRMGYLIFLGKLTIDKNALKLVKRPDHLEAHIIITCCTLIDLMREVVEKAVGLNKGGVVGSE